MSSAIERIHDPEAMDTTMIVPAIQASYWGTGRSREGIRKSFRNSDLAGLFQAGLWMLVTRDAHALYRKLGFAKRPA